MSTIRFVQVRAVRFGTGEAVWCKPENADAFSVYIGEPGDFVWIADFADQVDALMFTEAKAQMLGAEVDNRIGEV
jgi:hypothetical protein